MREICYVPEREALPDKTYEVITRWHLRFRRPLDAGSPGKLNTFCDKTLNGVTIAEQEHQLSGTALVCVTCLNLLIRAIALTD